MSSHVGGIRQALVVFSIVGLLVFGEVQHMYTRFRDDGVWLFRWYRFIHVPWAAISEWAWIPRGITPMLIITSPARRYAISLMGFAEPEQVVAYVDRQLRMINGPRGTVWE